MAKKYIIGIFLILSSVIGSGQSQVLTYSFPEKPWNEDLGNHRAEIIVNKLSDAVYVNIPWRRRDTNPEQKRLVITDQQGNEMKNVFRININREFGEFVFQPESGATTYYVYYMPYMGNRNSGWFDGDYLKPEDAPDVEWVKRNNLQKPFDLKNSLTTEATIKQIQSRTAFDSFYPMEVCATASETKQLVSSSQDDYLLFPEDRKYPIRMTNDLPLRWIGKKPSTQFRGTVMKNEYYAFQIGVYAAQKDLEDIKVSYSDYQDKLTCFNLEGVDAEGVKFIKKVDVPKGKVQALWFGVDIPEDIPAGEYSVDITIIPKNNKPQTVTVTLNIEDNVLADRGDSEPWRHSRLRWLNSTLGINDAVIKPYTPLEVKGKEISCLMRDIQLNDQGFISGMKSNDISVLNRPMQFVIETDAGIVKLHPQSFEYTKQNEGKVSWKAESAGDVFALTALGTMEFDGTINYVVKVKANSDIHIKDIRLEFPVKKDIGQYFMGMGLPGCLSPESYDWKWKGPQDSYWIGNVNAGFHCEMRGASYSGPMLNLYHPLPPSSWYNQNNGGFSLKTSGKEVVASTYSGGRTMTAGQDLTFEFALLITPVKKLNPADQFTSRYYHNGNKPAPSLDDLKTGIKITNVHHANPINPYINYPFIAVDSMRNFVDYWHSKGLKVKIYYTIRELTNQVPEIWALRSLGTEVLGGGDGGGYPWLREHFVDNYTVQWFTPINGYQACDAAVITSGKSRWYNYYIEGLRWLVKNQNIDGLYLDDVAFDRGMLKRMRSVMDNVKQGCLLDLHSNTGFSIGPANQYTEFFPFINKIWFGESFNYDKMSPENWLVETSGIPFGLMGDMLQGGGNPWRGMIYGMTVRYPWYTEGVNCDPREVWKIWDHFDIAHAKMIGYWDKSCPVKTNNAAVLATAYVHNGKTLVSLASWATSTSKVKLNVDWKSLGIDPSKAKISAPAIPGFQVSEQFSINDEISVEPKKGWLLFIENR
jgi:hypothetical protein